MPLIPWPDIRQTDRYDCGDAVYRGACGVVGVDPAAGSIADPHTGVSPDNLEIAFRRLGLHVQMGSFTLADLHHHTQLGRAVCALIRSGSTGHWVGVRGIGRCGTGPVYYHDPIEGQQMAKAVDWNAGWWDDHRSGARYERYAVIAFV